VEQNWTSEELWIEKKWVKESNVRYLTNEKYNDWIVNAPEGSKPWFVVFGDTAFGNPNLVQTTDAFMNILSCVSKLYGDTLNVGLMDYRKSEKTHETYDFRASYGQQAPYLMMFKDGKAYHFSQSSISTDKVSALLEDPEG